MQTPEVKQAIDSAIHFLLERYDPLQGNYPLHESGKVSPLWSRLNFPLFYQADLLLVLRSLAELNRLEAPGAGRVLEWLARRRSPNGRWKGSSPFRQRTWREMGDPRRPTAGFPCKLPWLWRSTSSRAGCCAAGLPKSYSPITWTTSSRWRARL